jgi:hopanoid biosynthesis associated protein HpnK
MKELIINADDFGLTQGVNEGIIRAHLNGVLTSATLMANKSAFDDAAKRARENLSLGVGCHLVLVGGFAVAPPKEISSLVDADGRLPQSLGKLVAKLSLGIVRQKHIEWEFRAQIEKIRGAGIEPSHLDTHKHTHAHPRVMKALAHVAKSFGITRVRKPFESLRDSWTTARINRGKSCARLPAAAAARAATPLFRFIARRHGLRSPDHFLGLAGTGHMNLRLLRCLIDTLPDGRTELMLHPGICDADLAATHSRLQKERQSELDLLLDPELKRLLIERGIRLMNFRELN